MKTWIRRLALLIGALGAATLVLGTVAFLALDTPRPAGVTDAAADALATKMIESVNPEGWARTGAITFTYGGRFNHLWDRERHLVRVRKDGWEALVDIERQEGVAFEDGVSLQGAARAEAVKAGYAAWANDSFWLNAMNKAFDGGTSRSRVAQPDGRDALLVAYSSGGVTPGDAYLWHLDDAGRPVSWQMWVSIIPIGGASASWDGWVQLATGAWVSTMHTLGPLDIEVTDLRGAETLQQLEPGPDPFARLMGAVAP